MSTDDELRRAYAPIAAHEPTSRTDCPSPEELEAVVGGSGAESSRIRVLSHMTQCAACARDVALLRTAAVGAREIGGAGATVVPLRRPRSWLAAAALLLAAGAGLWMVGPWRSAPDNVIRGAGEGIIAIAPAGEVAADSTLTFTWHALSGVHRYTVEVLSTDGGVLLSRSTPDTTLTVAGATLAAGQRYRWTVSAFDVNGVRRRSAPMAILPRSK